MSFPFLFGHQTTNFREVLPQTLSWFNVACQENIYPVLSTCFDSALPDSSKLRVVDAFVVKYDAAGGQKELKPHRDGSVISFNIALNPSSEYEGGGTWFQSLGRSLKLEQVRGAYTIGLFFFFW